MAQGFVTSLRRALGVEEKKAPAEKKLTASEQKAVDKAVPRRFESTVKPKPAPKKKPATPVTRDAVPLESLGGKRKR
jgi:hypothetical protein